MARIIGENIMLREYRESDFENLRRWANDIEVTKYLSSIFDYPHSEKKTRDFINHMMDKGTGFVIAHKKDGSYIGQIDLFKINQKDRSAELGLVIGKKDLQGKGYGQEALKLLQKFVFETININRLQLLVHSENERAINCYKKAGFIEEGRMREALYFEGRYVDHIIMSILKSEYFDRKKA